MQGQEMFKTVYAPPCAVNDHTFLWSNGLWHLFHIWVEAGGPRDNVIGHAVSRDLCEWEAQPDILPKDPAPSWEDHPGANAPYVVEWNGLFYLLYSRYQLAPHGKYEMQQIGLATSRDLYAWTKYEKNPVFHPESYWSPWEDAFSELYRPGGCRDPHVIRYHDKWVMYYVANTRTDRVSAVGHAVSDDLIHWSDKGPVFTMPVVTTGCKMLESPCVVQHGRRWHLFVNHGQGMHHAAADTPFNFPEATLLCTSHASEVFFWQGEWYISNCRNGTLGLARLTLSGDRVKLLPF